MKILRRISFGIVYLAAMIFCLFALAKPRSAIFYKKFHVDTKYLSQERNAFAYQFRFDNAIYNPGELLLLEGKKVLGYVKPEYSISEGEGVFTFERTGKQQITFLFTPTEPSDPTTNGHSYTIYIQPLFVSSHWVLICFLVLTSGLTIFLVSSLAHSEKRKTLLSSPFGIINLWNESIDQFFADKSRIYVWKKTALNAVLIAFVYVFFEWVFFITKPSFMDMLNWGEKGKILFITGLAVISLPFLTFPLILLLDFILSPVIPSFHKYIYTIPSTVLLTSLSLLLLDNFTYTILKFGALGSEKSMRIIYALGFISLFLIIYLKTIPKIQERKSLQTNQIMKISIFALLGLSIAFTFFTYNPVYRSKTIVDQNAKAANTPNIIFLSSDGLNAKNMSVYGYERDTTPFMKKLAASSLVGLNNFPNANKSLGSETALLTGKLPLATRVLFSPNTLTGSDMFEHLPGLLRKIGYKTVSMGVPYHVDVNLLNFQNAFDEVNCEMNTTNVITSVMVGYGYSDEVYFLSTIWGRIRDRLQHIFFIEDKKNPITYVSDSSNVSLDAEQMNCLYAHLDDARQDGQPLFAHIHLMGTHGSRFSPEIQVFSKDKEQDDIWLTDFYDDTILSFDMVVKNLMQYLDEYGMYDNTIVVLYTDHGQQWTTNDRLPLIIHFPEDDHIKEISENTQNVDIAPTILDYMEIQQPEWMYGNSLLDPVNPSRYIIAAKSPVEIIAQNETGNFSLVEEKVKPPFYQFEHLSVTQCQNWYDINLLSLSMTEGKVENYVNPCSPDDLDSPEQVWEKMGKILTRFGFQIPEDW